VVFSKLDLRRMTDRCAALLLALGLGVLAGAGCASAPSAAPATAPAPAPASPVSAPAARPLAARDTWLDMFARGYYPGRSGQIFVVPREGVVITEHDPLYGFMHGSPWEYDTHIPLLLHGSPFVKPGTYDAPARQQDVAPTLAAIIGATLPPAATGRVLTEAVQPGARPRVVLLLVLDAMRADYFDRYAELMPALSRLRRDGAWFANTRIDYLPTVTSVGHATVGTGTDPNVHGLAANTTFNRITRRPQPAYAGLDPRELMTPTLGDVWNLATDGLAVIVGQGGAMRATAGLVGHGACIVNGRKVNAASYNPRDGGWETNPECYRIPDYLKAINARTFWEQAGGTWMGHDISNGSAFRASSLFQRFEGEALVTIATNEPFGEDEVTDLLMVNVKGPDYVGHAYGPDGPEIKEQMGELDRQIARLLEVLGRKAGTNGLLVAITADHGMPAEPAAGQRYYPDDIVKRIHERFDPAEKKLIGYYSDAANNQLFVDAERLRALNVSLKDIATMLAAEPYYAAVFTEDEVRSAQQRLRPVAASAKD
jgi:predicted AlkP superfamily pyrophosphatase or phosphodiesterase